MLNTNQLTIDQLHGLFKVSLFEISTIKLVLIFLTTLALSGTLKAQKVASYVGSETCAGCHQSEYQKWQGSHHDWAMQPASAKTVLGDFNNASFSHQGVTTTFTRNNKGYFVNTQGADGRHQTFDIIYTFGVEPLQQYLIGFPDGRYQALTIAWDSRPEGEGGQRWYQLMPNDLGQPGESLHWTGAYYNWNAQCAECHTTGLKKNYAMTTNSYNTQWAESNVGCESCHGPGSAHTSKPTEPLPTAYSEQLQWVIAEGASIANPTGDPHAGSKIEIESCAGCHSRRSKISHNAINQHQLPGSTESDFLDHFQPQTLQEGLYHADGQIQDEVYVYGSFMQSKMAQRGVRCSNCHDPHSQKLKVQGNAVCAGCHAPETYNSAEHHFHPGSVTPEVNSSPGAQCVNCHMPATIYMGVDARRDHSMRIPDPIFAEKIGAPNACNMCHTDKSNSWAGSAISQWLKSKPKAASSAHYGEALYAARNQQQGADRQLIELANNSAANNIARATALELLQQYPSRQSYQAARNSLNNESPMVRLAALDTLEFLPANNRWADISPLLDDKVRGIRQKAVQMLLASPDPEQRQQLQKYLPAYMSSLMVNADIPAGQLILGEAYMAQGLYSQAQEAFRHALKLDQYNVGAFANLSDSYRAQGLEKKSLEILLEATQVIADNAPLLHALGLAQIRSQQPDKALPNLRRAAQLSPENSRYSYVLAIALSGIGEPQQALSVLSEASKLHPQDWDILLALVTINRDMGRSEQAKLMAAELVRRFPDNTSAKQLFKSL